MSPLPPHLTKHDPWAEFRQVTRARIGLNRCGDGLPTTDQLAFQLAHAHARDAVHGTVDFDALASKIAPSSSVVRVHSAATDRTLYLRRPDLGRRLDPSSRESLMTIKERKQPDAVIIIADGLSAAAINDHAWPTLSACLPLLSGWTLAPVILAQQARVALADEIGSILEAKLSVIMIGERPGLSVANSMGIYLTYGPCIGRKDSERNCISNIHGNGLSHSQAAQKLCWLMDQAIARQTTGISLKENAEIMPLIEPHQA